MIPLLLDAGLPRRAAEDLRAEGWDIVHVADLGIGDEDDAGILDRARGDARVVVTLDHDFAALMYAGGYSSPSVVLLRIEGLDRAATVVLLRRLIPQIESQLAAGAIVSVTRDAARVRSLPMR